MSTGNSRTRDALEVGQQAYKGRAEYWSVEAGGERFDDVAWSYRYPVPGIAGLVAFYDEQADVFLDGALQDKPRSPFS